MIDFWSNQVFPGLIKKAVVVHFAEYLLLFFMKLYNRCLVSFSNFAIVLINWSRGWVELSDFVCHSYDYRPNWTPLSPINIINGKHL